MHALFNLDDFSFVTSVVWVLKHVAGVLFACHGESYEIAHKYRWLPKSIWHMPTQWQNSAHQFCCSNNAHTECAYWLAWHRLLLQRTNDGTAFDSNEDDRVKLERRPKKKLNITFNGCGIYDTRPKYIRCGPLRVNFCCRIRLVILVGRHIVLLSHSLPTGHRTFVYILFITFY